MSRPTNLAYLDDALRPCLGEGTSLMMDYEDLMEWQAVLLLHPDPSASAEAR